MSAQSATPAHLRSLRENNFDLLRLLAATQVAFIHADNHLHLKGTMAAALSRAFAYFPGVPIFFVISGYLIAMSLEVNPRLPEYFRNRALRIFPGLWVCQVMTIVTVALCYSDWPGMGARQVLQFGKWLLLAFTIMPGATPPFLSGYGSGGLNGSLWTITVELQFYLCLPLLLGLVRKARLNLNVTLTILVLALYPLGAWYEAHIRDYWGQPSFQLLALSLLPYLHMFLLGVLLQKNFLRWARFLKGKALIWAVVYVLLAVLLHYNGLSVETNVPNLLSMSALAAAIIASAYTAPRLAERLLGRNDISYGVYIYHMPVFNAFLALGLVDSTPLALGALALTFLLAYLSWRLVEKPCLALKKHALRAVPQQAPAALR